MSRYSIELDNKGRTDNEAVIGYDKPLRTFFLHGFIPEIRTWKSRKSGLEPSLRNFPRWNLLLRKPTGRVARFAA